MGPDVTVKFDDLYALVRDRGAWLRQRGEPVPDELCKRMTHAMNEALRERREALPPAMRRPPDPPVIPWKPKDYA